MIRGLFPRLRNALPSTMETLVGGLAWGALMAANAWLGLQLAEWQTSQSVEAIVLLFGVGAALGYPSGLFLARFLAFGRAREARVAIMLLGLAVSTIGITAGIYILVYKSYYDTWHAPAFTVTWAYQWVFTAAGALAQFAAFGLRLYFPIGFVALLATSFWLGSKPR